MIHSGDFKIDLTPPDGQPFDLHAFAEYGKRGVLALLQDSTNVDRHGHTPSERAVRPALDEVFARTKQRLFFSCFSSSIHRRASRQTSQLLTVAKLRSLAGRCRTRSRLRRTSIISTCRIHK